MALSRTYVIVHFTIRATQQNITSHFLYFVFLYNLILTRKFTLILSAFSLQITFIRIRHRYIKISNVQSFVHKSGEIVKLHSVYLNDPLYTNKNYTTTATLDLLRKARLSLKIGRTIYRPLLFRISNFDIKE